MDDFLRQMGLRIYQRRKELRLTQEELAEAAGLTSQMVSTAELGKKALRPENIVKLAEALEVSTDYLLRGKITNEDYILLSGKIAALSTTQYHYLEDIVKNFISAIKAEQDRTNDSL